MIDTTKRDYLPDSPYPGIEPFSYAHRNVFFAREMEARTLNRLIVMYRGVLLYSDSGTGKSSLVNAGLIPLAMDERYQPERIRVQPRGKEEIIVERLSENADDKPPFLPSILAPDEEQKRMVLSVEKFLEMLRQRAKAVHPLLIFDQFEEWVTLFEQDSTEQVSAESRAIKERILNALIELFNDSELPVKVLIVLREDYLAKLTPLFERCPSLPDQYLRLMPLKGDQIYRVIRGPFEEYPGRYQPEVSPSLAKEIRTQFEGRSGGADIHLTEVQIVCQSLFETGKQEPELDQTFADQEGVQGILERYLEHALESLEVGQRELAVGLLTRMVTSAGTRKRILKDDLLSRVESEDGVSLQVLDSTLNSLEQKAKLVRRERLRNAYYYEIASEFLLRWIQQKAQERQWQVEQRKLKELALVQERAKRLRWGIGLGVILAVSAIFAAWSLGRERGINEVISWIRSLDASYPITASNLARIASWEFGVGPTDIIGGEEEEEEEELPPTSVLLPGELVEAAYRLRLLKNSIGFEPKPLDPDRSPKISFHEHYRVGGDIGAYFEAMGTLGIQKAVFFPTGFDPDNRGYPENMEELLRLQKLYPMQIIAFCTVDEGDAEAPSVFKDCLEKGGHGLKLIGGHPDFYEPEHPLDSPTMMQVYEIADRRHVPVVIHINMRKFPGLQAQFEHVLQTFPNVPFVAAHYCKDTPPFELCAHLLDTYSNLYTDISMGGALDRYLADISIHRDDYRNFILRYEDRILWGVDLIIDDPQTKTADFIRQRISYDLYLLETGSEYNPSMQGTFQDIPKGVFAPGDVQLFGLDLPEETLRKIYSDNPRRVLSISD